MAKNMIKSEQRGTLLVEAIAMLGLIAMVTPTLYKKSAERLQEIQDINVATQARMMGNVIDTFVRSNLSSIKDYTSSATGHVVELCENDHQAGCFAFGYSSAIPSGFQPDDLKGFKAPKVYVRNDENKLVYYIMYPKHNEIGKRRAARLASLVGANGGYVDNPRMVQGVGGAWELDSTMINEMAIDSSMLVENSLVVTAPEPIVATIDDSDKYLYRVPDNENPFHNTMVTDLYLGGHQDGPDSGFSQNAQDFYSIFNVRKLTLNTKCKYGEIKNNSATTCLPDDVADLYIGKPDEKFSDATPHSGGPRTFGGNKGAAWIYGNLSALSDRFKVFHTNYQNEDNYSGFGRNGYDVLRFARTDTSDGEVWDESSTVELDILRATNEEGSAEVGMMDGFVRVVENYTKEGEGTSFGYALLVGSTSATGDNEGGLIEAYEDRVNINNAAGYTRINPNGGWVYINGSSSGASAAVAGETYINQGGGLLWAGQDGSWFTADGAPFSATVHILNGGESGSTSADRQFIVGTNNEDKHMILANEDKVSLRGGNVRVYDTIKEQASSGTSHSIGAGDDSGIDVSSGTTVIASRITDILGGTYMGAKANMTAPGDGVSYARATNDATGAHWTLGVAGSAWVDDLLYARQAWFSDAGFKNLHAGFSSYADYSSHLERGWLNVYGGNDGRVVIRDPNKAHGGSSNIGDSSGVDTMLYADSTYTYIGDTVGSYAAFQDGVAYIGTASLGGVNDRNFFAADSSSAHMVGSSLAEIYTAGTGNDDFVDIQRGAMLFNGHSWSGDDRSSHIYDNNTIEAHAQQFTIHTKEILDAEGESAAVFYADADNIRTRYVDFSVEDDSSLARFKVMPNEDPEATTGSANVMINGSFHVTGNNVIHIASNSSNAAGIDDDNPHAVFEVDPEFVKVMAIDNAGNFQDAPGAEGEGATLNKLAILKVNPKDIQGGESLATDTQDASVYIRRGAIELEESVGSSSDAYAANQGYGYILANRFVSNVTGSSGVVPQVSGNDAAGKYDKFMVNPAYTSVMHDIKLTTRGGARLSDILPDYILKGVYNVSNDFLEGSKTQRIRWSAGDACTKGDVRGSIECKDQNVAWANTYVGIIPYAICPRGYKNLATIIPISFRMGQAGEVIKADQIYSDHVSEPSKSIKYVVNPSSRQTRHILSIAARDSSGIVYPWLQEVSSYVYNSAYTDHPFPPNTYSRTEGWFWGLDFPYNGTDIHATTDARVEVVSSASGNAYKYAEGTSGGGLGRKGIVAEPLYFQQNTFLKTALAPDDQGYGWEGRMGFLYDRNEYTGPGTFDNTGIASNNNDGDNESSTTGLPGDWIWNLFPVATNTLEGHATVYCYFDRKNFKDDWSSYVDQIDQLNHDTFRPITSWDEKKPDSPYRRRLNDPTLKYDDPW